jgi:hypothetical protein
MKKPKGPKCAWCKYHAELLRLQGKWWEQLKREVDKIASIYENDERFQKLKDFIP